MGGTIRSRAANDAYRDGWDRTFVAHDKPMLCPHCRIHVRIVSRTRTRYGVVVDCDKCGTMVIDDDVPKVCPYCGRVVADAGTDSRGALFECGACGRMPWTPNAAGRR